MNIINPSVLHTLYRFCLNNLTNKSKNDIKSFLRGLNSSHFCRVLYFEINLILILIIIIIIIIIIIHFGSASYIGNSKVS